MVQINLKAEGSRINVKRHERKKKEIIKQLHKKQSIWTTIGLCVYIKPMFTNFIILSENINNLYSYNSYIHKKAVNNNLQSYNKIPCVIIIIKKQILNIYPATLVLKCCIISKVDTLINHCSLCQLVSIVLIKYMCNVHNSHNK